MSLRFPSLHPFAVSHMDSHRPFVPSLAHRRPKGRYRKQNPGANQPPLCRRALAKTEQLAEQLRMRASSKQMKRSGRKVAAGFDFRLVARCFVHSRANLNMSDGQDSYASVDADASDVDVNFDFVAPYDGDVVDDEIAALLAVACDQVAAAVVAAHALVSGVVAATLLSVVCDYVTARVVAAHALVLIAVE